MEPARWSPNALQIRVLIATTFPQQEPPPRLSALSELARLQLILALASAPAVSDARRLHGPSASALRPALRASPDRGAGSPACSAPLAQFPGVGMQMLRLVRVGAAAAAAGFPRTACCLRSGSCCCCL